MESKKGLFEKVLNWFNIEIDRHICKFKYAGRILQCEECKGAIIIWKRKKKR